MPFKKHKPEEIIGKLREAEIVLAQGASTLEACRRIAVSEQTYYRWRKEYGGLKTDQARQMKDLEKENMRSLPGSSQSSLADVAITPTDGHFAIVTDARSFLIKSLRHVVGGGDMTNDELHGAVDEPARLRGAERKAWHGLSYWADDDDVRAKDASYASSRRRQLADLLADLESEKGR